MLARARRWLHPYPDTAGALRLGFVAAYIGVIGALIVYTNFVNPCGLNNKKHFSSAKDLATLTRYALRDPVFSRIVDTIYFSLPPLAPVPPAKEETKRDFDNRAEADKIRAILNYSWNKTSKNEITAIQYALWYYINGTTFPANKYAFDDTQATYDAIKAIWAATP